MSLSALPVADSHAHLVHGLHEVRLLERIMEGTGAEAVNLACVPAGLIDRYASPHVNLLSLYAKFLHPRTIYVSAGLDYTDDRVREALAAGSRPARAAASDRLARQVETQLAMGADGIKMLEGKPDARKALGVPLCDPLFDGLWEVLEHRGVPVLLHLADPEEFWDPKLLPSWAKEWGWDYGDGSFSTKADLYAELRDIVRKHPALRITLAHLGFLSADPGTASAFLEEYPAVLLDLAPGSEMYSRFAARPDAWRSFFDRYRERILFGTDLYLAEAGEAIVERSIELFRGLRTFLETGERTDWGTGLALGPATLRSIYAGAFHASLGREPKPVDRTMLAEACMATASRLARDATHERSRGESLEIARRLLEDPPYPSRD